MAAGLGWYGAVQPKHQVPPEGWQGGGSGLASAQEGSSCRHLAQDGLSCQHAGNEIRLIAEYFVVRHHISPSHLQKGGYDEQARGPIGVNITRFFFVLSGFALEFSFELEDFSTWQAKKEFAIMKSRISQLYPIFLHK